MRRIVAGMLLAGALFAAGCGPDRPGPPDTGQSPRADTAEGPQGPYIFAFRRDARLLDTTYQVIGCASRGTVVESTGHVPYPKGPDGKALRDPDDGSVLSMLYRVVFSADHTCGQDGSVARPGRSYWVNPAALARQDLDLPAHAPRVAGVEVSGTGCPDTTGWVLGGTADAANLNLFLTSLRVVRGESGAEAAEQQLGCRSVVRVRVPRGGTVRRLRELTTYDVYLDDGSRASVNRVLRVSGAEQPPGRQSHAGPFADRGSIAAEVVPAGAFCRDEVEVVLEHELSVSATAGGTRPAFEVGGFAVDYWLDVAACP